METEDRQLFDSIAEDYLKKDLTSYSRIARKMRLERTLKHVRKPIPSLLEVGCGAGFTAAYLKGEYVHYTGLDYSQNLISYADKFNRFPGVTFLCRNIREFSSNEKYAVILMVGVLHHIPEPEKVLLDLKNVLSPDGILVVNEPQRGNPIIGALRKLRKKLDAAYSSDQVEFSETQIKSLFEGSGYDVRTFPQGVLSTPLAETLIFPAFVGLPLALALRVLDPVLEFIISVPFLRTLSWNVVVEARARLSDQST